MTRAASDRPMKVSVEKYVPPSRVEVNLEKHPHMDGKHKVGDKVHFVGKGKISSINESTDHSTMAMDVHTIKKLKAKPTPNDHGDAEDAADQGSDEATE